MNADLMEDDAMDSGQEDYDTEELKLQDIAAIVLGDVKQVCINAVTSDSENESFSAHCYGSSDVSKIDNESDIGVLHDDNVDYKKDITVLNLPDESKELVNGICKKSEICGTDEKCDFDNDKSDIELHVSDLDSNLDSAEGGTPVVGNSASSTSSVDRSPRKPSPVMSPAVIENHQTKLHQSHDIEFTIAETESTLKKLHVGSERSPSSIQCDEKIQSNFTPNSNNLQLCCDRENLEKLLECDSSNDEFPKTKQEEISNVASPRHEMVTDTDDCPLECNEYKDAVQESKEICERLKEDLQLVQFSHSSDNSICDDVLSFINIDIPLPPDDPPPMSQYKNFQLPEPTAVDQNEPKYSQPLDELPQIDQHERKSPRLSEKSPIAKQNFEKFDEIESFHDTTPLKNERKQRSKNRKDDGKKSTKSAEPVEEKNKSCSRKSSNRRSNSKKSSTRSPEDIGRDESKKRRKSRSKKEKSPNENRSPKRDKKRDTSKSEQSSGSSKKEYQLSVKERRINRRSRKEQSDSPERADRIKSIRNARSNDKSFKNRSARKSRQRRSSDESVHLNEIRSPLRNYDREKFNEWPRYEESSDRSFRTADRSPVDFRGGDKREESFEYERVRSWERRFATADRSLADFERDESHDKREPSCDKSFVTADRSPTDRRNGSPKHGLSERCDGNFITVDQLPEDYRPECDDSFSESVPEKSDANFVTVDQLPDDYRPERDDSLHESIPEQDGKFVTVDQVSEDYKMDDSFQESGLERDGKFVLVDQVSEDYKIDDRPEHDDSFHESIPEHDGKFVTVDEVPDDYKMDDHPERNGSFPERTDEKFIPEGRYSAPEPKSKFFTVDQLPEDCPEPNFVTIEQLPNRSEHDSFHSVCEPSSSSADFKRDKNDRSCDRNSKTEHRSPEKEDYRRSSSSRKSRYERSRDRSSEDYRHDKSRNRRQSRDRSHKDRSHDDKEKRRKYRGSSRSSRHEASSDRSFRNRSPEEYNRGRNYRESSRSSRRERSNDRDYRRDERNKHSGSSHSSRNERSSDRSSRNGDRSPDDRKRSSYRSSSFRGTRSPDDRRRRSESCRSKKSTDRRYNRGSKYNRNYRYSSTRRKSYNRDEKSKNRSYSSDASSDREPDQDQRSKRNELKDDLVRNVDKMLKTLADQSWNERPPEPPEPPESECPRRSPEPEYPVRPPEPEYTVRPPKSEYPVRPIKWQLSVRPPKREYPVRPPKPEYSVQPPKPEYSVRSPQPEYPIRPPEPKSPPPPTIQDRMVENQLKSLTDENWDEELLEPELPTTPIEYLETDYKPPEPNYPPPDDDDRPPSPVDESTEPPIFEPILENEYRTERSVSKDAERMICDCVLTREEIHRGEKGCGDDCLNRLLLIECCSRCSLAERCTNKRFQRREYPKCEVYKTTKKGNGLRILQDVPSGTFIMEYVGEVLNSYEFERRAMEYAKGKNPHFYFMSLKSDCIIDATVKGNISRFINHSCEPNAETQKWTVQGELRIGFFSRRDIKAGEEITFDYQLQRYGKQAQRCYCNASICSGWIGGDPNKSVESKRGKKRRDEYLDWETTLDEISQVGLMNRHQTLSLNRLMVHAKELPVRMQILQLIKEGNPPCRRLFVDYQGLPIIWSWMVDCTPEQDELKIQLLKTLAALPITNKTILVDSKVLTVVEQWAFMVDQKTQSSEALSAQSVLESVEDITSAEETPVSELAQKVLNDWSSLREAYKIPKKERIQQMKKHEEEADENVIKARPKRLPMYAEQMRDRNRRNRHKDKDFTNIYYDRMNDYDNGSADRKRKESPERRNFDRKHQRRSDYNKDGANNRFSKQEHRFMFEMKVARENERKREEEEQQQQWFKAFYSQTQPPIPGLMLPPQYLTSIPPPNYPADQKSTPVSHTIPYYTAVPPSGVYPSLLPPPGTPNTQPPATTVPQVNSVSQYYRGAVPYPPQTPTPVAYPTQTPTPVAYPPQTPAPVAYPPRPATVEPQRKTDNEFTFDSQTVKNQLQQIATLDEIPVPQNPEEAEPKPEFNFASVNVSDVDSTALKLPPKWKTAKDAEGRTYFYHTKTRVSQWYPPAWESRNDDDSSAGEDDDDVEFKKKRRKSEEKVEFDMDAEIKENLAAMSSEFQDSDYEDYSPILKTEEPEENAEKSIPTKGDTPSETVPLITEHIISPREPIDPEERRKNKKRIRYLKEKLRKQKKQKLMNGGNHTSGTSNGHHSSNGSKLVSAPADTSSITERKKKDAFRSHMANFVVNCLNPYFRSSCTQARITNYSDFKHLARKLTHFVMLKELKHCQSVSDLTCNSSVKHKAKEYIRKYMSKFGEVYEKPPDDNNY